MRVDEVEEQCPKPQGHFEALQLYPKKVGLKRKVLKR